VAAQSSGGGPAVVMTGAGCLAVIAVFCVQVAGCYALMRDHWGWHPLVCIGLMALLMFFRLDLLFAVGCFFGALLAWDWPWWGALLIAAPGLVASIMLLVGGVTISSLSGLFKPK
jgi:hypothetical protein